MLQRPARSALTALGTVLGVGTFVAILGLTATTSSQIDSRFNVLTATEVNVEDIGLDQNEFVPLAFPNDSDRLWRGSAASNTQGSTGPWSPATPMRPSAPHLLSTPHPVKEPTLSLPPRCPPGRRTASGARPGLRRLCGETAQPVVMIGAGIAARLGITTLETRPALFIGDQPFTVVAIIDDVKRKADLLLSVVVPRSAAEKLWGEPTAGGAKMLISTKIGAAQQVAQADSDRAAPRITPNTSSPNHRPIPRRCAAM